MTMIHIFTEEGIRKIDPLQPLSASAETSVSGIVWTEPVGSDECGAVIVNSKAQRQTFLSPKLVAIRGREIIISALSDHDASGSGIGVQKFYIVIET